MVKKHIKNKTEIELKEPVEGPGTRYRHVFEAAHDGILLLDAGTGRIMDVNPFLEEMLGYSKRDFINKKLWEVKAFTNIKSVKESLRILQKKGYLRYEDLPLETKDGRSISVQFVSNTYVADGVLVIQCNIRNTVERKVVDQMRDTRRLLEEEKMKVQTIAEASHELRTPLAIIKGNVDLAMKRIDGKPLKSPQNALKAINYEVKHLTRILSDLSLITSRSWQLKNRFVYDEVNLKSLISQAVSRCKALAYKKNISVVSKAIPHLFIYGDRGYLEKMLVNLIKNSITYGRENGHTRITAKKSGKGFVSIKVCDNGIGISREDLPFVFERFYRADRFDKVGKDSIGLGLAIVKWVAEVHGGAVSVVSEENKGSCFSVSLPIKE